MCDYITGLDMSVFVYDYDHNAPTVDFLKETHEKFFLRFRESKPDTPVIMISAACKAFEESVPERREVIYTTYKNALNRGDKNVYFIDGQTMYLEPSFDLCTVDRCHPNDLGFYFMGKKIREVIEKLL